MSFSMSATKRASARVTRVTARPDVHPPARPSAADAVDIVLGVEGDVEVKTAGRSAMSRPRAATSVATSRSTSPRLKASSDGGAHPDLSPCRARPFAWPSRSKERAGRATPSLELPKTMAWRMDRSRKIWRITPRLSSSRRRKSAAQRWRPSGWAVPSRPGWGPADSSVPGRRSRARRWPRTARSGALWAGS